MNKSWELSILPMVRDPSCESGSLFPRPSHPDPHHAEVVCWDIMVRKDYDPDIHQGKSRDPVVEVDVRASLPAARELAFAILEVISAHMAEYGQYLWVEDESDH